MFFLEVVLNLHSSQNITESKGNSVTLIKYTTLKQQKCLAPAHLCVQDRYNMQTFNR